MNEINKYFDAVNSKIFTLNNIMIGGYFALSVFKGQFSNLIIIIPFINFLLIIGVDLAIMSKKLYINKLNDIAEEELSKKEKRKLSIRYHFQYGLSSIAVFSTLGTFIYFLYLVVNINKV